MFVFINYLHIELGFETIYVESKVLIEKEGGEMKGCNILASLLILFSFSGFSQIEQNFFKSSGDKVICYDNSYNNPSCTRKENLNTSNEVPNEFSDNVLIDPNSINDAEEIYHNDYSKNEVENNGSNLTYPANVPERFQYTDPYEMREDPYEATYPDPYQPTSRWGNADSYPFNQE